MVLLKTVHHVESLLLLAWHLWQSRLRCFAVKVSHFPHSRYCFSTEPTPVYLDPYSKYPLFKVRIGGRLAPDRHRAQKWQLSITVWLARTLQPARCACRRTIGQSGCYILICKTPLFQLGFYRALTLDLRRFSGFCGGKLHHCPTPALGLPWRRWTQVLCVLCGQRRFDVLKTP